MEPKAKTDFGKSIEKASFRHSVNPAATSGKQGQNWDVSSLTRNQLTKIKLILNKHLKITCALYSGELIFGSNFSFGFIRNTRS
jgi:hypothetical protein